MAFSVINGKLVRTGGQHSKRFKEARDSFGFMPQTAINPTEKGAYLGRCNFTACESGEWADWYNRGSMRFYCEDCAKMLSHENRHDEFCKDQPLCYKVTSFEQAALVHVMP